MSPEVDKLYQEMVAGFLPAETGLPAIEKNISLIQDTIHFLKKAVLKKGFGDPLEEIYFFKAIKPLFYAQAIYYHAVYRLEINRPPFDREVQASWLQQEQEKNNIVFKQHRGLYRYLRSGRTDLDALYFTRNAVQFLLTGTTAIDRDPLFSAAQDFNVAKLEACRMFAKHISIILQQQELGGGVSKSDFTWTAQKVGLAELIYALQASGVFNNSQAGLKKITDYFSVVFNIPIANIYKILEEIRMRKKNRTVFLDALRNNLLRKMDEDDEHAL